MKKIEEILETSVKYLNQNDIDYVFVGGLTVIVYGNPRTTVDLDLIAQLDEEQIEEFTAYLRDRGFFCDTEGMKDAFSEETHFSAEEKDSLFRLDIKGVYGPKEKKTLRNRKKVEYEGIDMYVSSPEDTIAYKLFYGSGQDIEDAESIFVRQYDNLDLKYLESRCEELGITEELEEMRREVDELADI